MPRINEVFQGVPLCHWSDPHSHTKTTETNAQHPSKHHTDHIQRQPLFQMLIPTRILISSPNFSRPLLFILFINLILHTALVLTSIYLHTELFIRANACQENTVSSCTWNSQPTANTKQHEIVWQGQILSWHTAFILVFCNLKKKKILQGGTVALGRELWWSVQTFLVRTAM